MTEQLFPNAGATRAKADLRRRIGSLGPALILVDSNDVFAHGPKVRALGCCAIIYSTWEYGFMKPGATKPSYGGCIVLCLNRTWTPEEHRLIWDAANHLLGSGFDKRGRSPTMCYPAHARRSEDAPYKRVEIKGSVLDADALIRLGRTLRPRVRV